MQIERNARCALAGLLFTTIVSVAREARAVCGDGVFESATEACDDGNTAASDGCNATCQTEAGYVCTGTDAMNQQRDLCCFSDAASAYALRASASLNEDTGEVTLVPNENNKVGVAWFRQTLDFTNPFKISLRLYLGTRDENPTGNAADQGADGGSILFQRSPAGLTAQGQFGQELGSRGILPVVGVEFDTYNNGAACDDITMGDEDHVSVFHTNTEKANQLTSGPQCLNDGAVCQNFEDGKYHRFEVEWTGNVDRHLKVYVEGKLRVDLQKDIVGSYFAGNAAGIWFGFAASTGASRNLHKFCPARPEGFMVPRDRDRDGVDDRVDQDDDGDGRSDLEETKPVFGATDPSADHDSDNTPNYADPDYWEDVLMRPTDCVDVLPPIGACDTLPRDVDRDGDKVPDHLDLDSDADTVADVIEDGSPDTTPADGKLDGCTTDPVTGLCTGTRPPPTDSNNDGTIDSRDPCVPNMMATACMSLGACVDPNAVACGLQEPAADRDGDSVTNATECATAQSCPDTDGDGSRDFNDSDSDGDGVGDRVDPDRLDPCNPDPKVARCGRGDADQDGLSNGTECPTPPTCVDTNNDGTPDYLDPDQDDDQVYDGTDSAPRDPCVPNPQALACSSGDLDRDGVVGSADPAPTDPCVPNPKVVVCRTGDADGDGLTNGTECPNVAACVDTDGDGKQDWEDLDSNNDGVNDGEEDRPEIAGGACSTSGAGGTGLGLLLPVLFATWAGRGWRRRRAA
ncbi:MAG: hypothetical protein ABW252_08840 [Polyangiales bacterium]